MKNLLIHAVFSLACIVASPSACSQVDENIKVEEEYFLIRDQFGDIIAAWNALLMHRELLESQGYTLEPHCFAHARYTETNTKTGAASTKLSFFTKQLYPDGCASFGTFYLVRDEGKDDWNCKLSISREEPLRDCHLGRE